MTAAAGLSVRTVLERWPLIAPIVARAGTFYEDETLLVELSDGLHTGRGETVGMLHEGEKLAAIEAQVLALRDVLNEGMSADELRQCLPSGSAGAVLDAALWDLEARRRGVRVDRLAGCDGAFSQPVHSLITIAPESIGQLPALLHALPADARLKLKLGHADDEDRLAQVRFHCPQAVLTVDANAAWTPARLAELMPALHAARVALIEQPLSVSLDAALRDFAGTIPFAADEACSDAASLDRLVGLYDFASIKLEKCGGLTRALEVAARARELHLRLMVGCFGGTSLSIAPAFMLASQCEFADLDAPLLLRSDRPGAAPYRGAWLEPPPAGFWG